MSKLEFTDVPGLPGYAVSRCGKVQRTKTGTILKTARHTQGYRSITTHVDGLEKTKLVHRLVAATFLGPCPARHYVNHIDGDKTNNAVTNLEYVTPKRNIEHARERGLMPKRSWAKLTDEKVAIIKRELELRRKYKAMIKTYAQIARDAGVSRGTVELIDKGKLWRENPGATDAKS